MNTGWVNEVSRALLRLKFLEERVEALEAQVTMTPVPLDEIDTPLPRFVGEAFPMNRKPGRPLGSKNKNGN